MALQQIGPWEPHPTYNHLKCFTLNYHEQTHIPHSSIFSQSPNFHSEKLKRSEKNKSSHIFSFRADRQKGKKNKIRRSVDHSYKAIQTASKNQEGILSSPAIETPKMMTIQMKKNLLPNFGLKRRTKMKLLQKDYQFGAIFKKISDMQNPQHRQNLSLPKIQINIK